jgi:hypothetical protein
LYAFSGTLPDTGIVAGTFQKTIVSFIPLHEKTYRCFGNKKKSDKKAGKNEFT